MIVSHSSPRGLTPRPAHGVPSAGRPRHRPAGGAERSGIGRARPPWIRWAAALLVLVALTGHGARGAEASDVAPALAPSTPNILVIMADDLDTHTLETLLKLGFLPHIERYIVKRGYRFTQSFVTNSLCCPSRATFLTGKYSHNHNVLTNDLPDGGVSALDDGSTIATLLQGAGYRTGHVGKYLNRYGVNWAAEETKPESPHYVPPGWNSWQALKDLSTYNVYHYWMSLYDDRTDQARRARVRWYGDQPEDYQTNVLAQRAARFIAESRLYFPNKPIFLTVTPLAPHVELFTIAATGKDEYQDIWRWYIRANPKDEVEKPLRWNFIFNALPLLSQNKPSFNEPSDVLPRPEMTPADIDALTWQYRTRFASMLAVDDLVGTVASALGSDLARTVIVFTSDNGFLYGEHRMAEKLVAYEESVRVPLYVAMPGVSGPIDVSAIVLNNDIAPTLAALASAVPPAADGTSLVGFLAGQTPPFWRKRFLAEHWGSDSVFDVPTYAAVRTGPAEPYPDRLYVEYYADTADPDRATAFELYDLRQDPYQLENEYGKPGRSPETAYLREQLATLKSCGMPDKARCQEVER